MSEVTSSLNVNSSNNVTGGGVDYNSGPYSVTFPTGDTIVPFKVPITFDVPINDDNILENTEMFTLTIDPSLPSRVTVGNPDRSTVTILDNDGE